MTASKGRWYVIGILPTRLERGNHNPVETYQLDSKGNVCTWYRYRPDAANAPVKLLQSTGLVVPGTGNLNFAEALELLKTESAYEGAYVIEYEADPKNPNEGMKKTLEVLMAAVK